MALIALIIITVIQDAKPTSALTYDSEPEYAEAEMEAESEPISSKEVAVNALFFSEESDEPNVVLLDVLNEDCDSILQTTAEIKQQLELIYEGAPQ